MKAAAEVSNSQRNRRSLKAKKKELYFTMTNMAPKAKTMLRFAKMLIPQRNLSFNPRQSALLILDMQKYFFDSSSHAFIPSAPAIVANISRLYEEYVRIKLPVIFTRHLNTTQDAGLLASWWKELIRESDPLSVIIPDLRHENQIVIKKSRYDAFMDSSLHEVLKKRNVKQLVIGGVMANVCCESTARSAFQKGYEVFFLVDGTAAYNERFHMASLLNLGFGFAELALTEDICKSIIELHEK
ncbi:MAG: cysteine hydrolase [Candidatus Aminicenantes bacterium]|nr:cysteine hydrolase [Candidatus Aminicenantes bacterium]